MDAQTINAGLTVVTGLVLLAGIVVYYVRKPGTAQSAAAPSGHAPDNTLIASVLAHAIDVFDTPDMALDWLRTPNRALGARPLDLLGSEDGRLKVDRLLGRIEHQGMSR